MRCIWMCETKIDHDGGFHKMFDKENFNLLRRDPSCLSNAELEACEILQSYDTMFED